MCFTENPGTRGDVKRILGGPTVNVADREHLAIRAGFQKAPEQKGGFARCAASASMGVQARCRFCRIRHFCILSLFASLVICAGQRGGNKPRGVAVTACRLLDLPMCRMAWRCSPAGASSSGRSECGSAKFLAFLAVVLTQYRGPLADTDTSVWSLG